MSIAKIKNIAFLVLMLVLLSLSLWMIKQSLFFLVPKTDFFEHMASMAAMIILTGIILVLCQKLKLNLSIFPAKFTPLYICATFIAGGLFVATPSNFTDGIESISLLVYTSIVIPVFEEIIFRGYVWNKLNHVFSKEWKTYIVSTILFALWHFGYIGSIAYRVEDGILYAMIWKVITGLCFGIVLGFVRLKSKNCYSTILLHGIMNIFGR